MIILNICITTFHNRSHMSSGKPSSGLCDDSKLKGGWSYSHLRGSCNQYLHCADDRAFIQTCAAGTFYDGEGCRHADEVMCPAGML